MTNRLPTRRSIRYPSHDMTGPGLWFITIHARRKQNLFGQVVDGTMCCNDLGRIVGQCWIDLANRFLHVRLDAWIVMPNHFHALLNLVASDARLVTKQDRIERFGRPVSGSVSTIIRSFKAASTTTLRQHVGHRVVIWQRRFHDTRICDPEGIARVRKYIADNPMRWKRRRNR